MQVNEVRSALQGAVNDVETAESQIRTVKQLIENALQATEIVRRGSVDPIGVPALRQLLEDLEKLLVLTRQYVDAATTYSSTM